MMPSNEEMKHMNGSKVETLPKPTCSKKYIWNLRVIVEKQRNQTYDPLANPETFYFHWNRA